MTVKKEGVLLSIHDARFGASGRVILHPLTGKFIVPEQSHKLQLRTILHDLRQLKPASLMDGIEAQYYLIPVTLPWGTVIVGKVKVKKDALQHRRAREQTGNMCLSHHAISIVTGRR